MDPRQVIYLFKEKLPNACGVDWERLAIDKAGMEAIVKALKGDVVGDSATTPAPAQLTLSF